MFAFIKGHCLCVSANFVEKSSCTIQNIMREAFMIAFAGNGSAICGVAIAYFVLYS